jgi:formylglycine-generating enzyme required for sulfatase activity
MSRLYFINDASGERQVDESAMPLRVGGAEQADVVIPGVSARTVVAHIALSEGHAYIQPAGKSPPLFHNSERLLESRWLKSGDQVQVEGSVLHWTVKGDQVYIDTRQRATSAGLTPPADPPPGSNKPTGRLPNVEVASPRFSHPRRRRAVMLLFAALVMIAAFVMIATPVALRISPEPDVQGLSGFPPAVPLGKRLLVLPGAYTVTASREGYRPLQERVRIPMGGFRELSFEMQELPGRVRIDVEPDVAFKLFVDDSEVPTDDHGVAEIERGQRRLRIETERYLSQNHSVAIDGRGQNQDVSFELQPAWAEVRITTQPQGAAVRVDDEPRGTTPLATQLLQGQRTIELSLAGHKAVILQQAIEAGTTVQLDDILMPPADGRLALHSEPGAATVSVDGDFRGTTPLTLTLASGTEHRLRVSKTGYRSAERGVTLAAEEQQELKVELTPEYGTVFVTARPADASLVVDGKAVGKATQRLRLTTRPHNLEFRKPGYETQRVTVTPRAGVSQNLDVTLKTVTQAKAAGLASSVTSAAGQRLLLLRPEGSFRMGASRREAGRRANESQRLIALERPFYLGEKEVTNGEFRRFRPEHDSGAAEGVRLNGDDQPVVNVSWEDAARYCNWLSQQDGLPPAYREQGGQMVAVQPATTGYRLPSEAEWAYVARVYGRSSPARYPWAGDYPPTATVGNFADARIADTLADVVPGYDDGYRGTAPAGSFAAQPGGFHDLGGNVAEWTNDFYAVYPGEAQKLVKDPTGPAAGEHHAVRGSSWRHGSITELRLSYRDYSRSPRNDLGFRIARFAH